MAEWDFDFGPLFIKENTPYVFIKTEEGNISITLKKFKKNLKKSFRRRMFSRIYFRRKFEKRRKLVLSIREGICLEIAGALREKVCYPGEYNGDFKPYVMLDQIELVLEQKRYLV